MDILLFQNGGRPPSWILLRVKNDVTARCGLSTSTTVPNLVIIAQTAAELLRFPVFQNGGRPPFWILLDFITNYPRSPTDELKLRLKFYVNPIYTFKDSDFNFSKIWLKMPIRAQKLGFLWNFTPNILGYH